MMRTTAVLLITCPDRKGLVAAVASLLYRYGANITHADQHQDHEAGLFFMRVEWTLEGFDLSAFHAEFHTTAAELQMRWNLKLMSEAPRMAVFVSQYLHCLVDLLHRQQAGELHCSIPLIIGNHHNGEALAQFYGVEFRHIAVKPQRGVKLMGATSHYVTAALDDGPIIEQDVVRISHRDQVEDLIRKGRYIEKAVLSRAVMWHLEHRILCYGNKTVVFD